MKDTDNNIDKENIDSKDLENKDKDKDKDKDEPNKSIENKSKDEANQNAENKDKDEPNKDIENKENITLDNDSTKNKKLDRKRLIFIFSIVILIIFSIIFIIIYANNKLNNFYANKFFPGTHINNIDVGGLTTTEAVSLLNVNLNEPLKNKKITFKQDKGFKETKKFADFNCGYNFDTITKNVITKEKSGDILTLSCTRINTRIHNTNYNNNFSYDEKKLDSYIKYISSKLNKESANARISITNNVPCVSKEVPGYALNESKLKKDTNTILKNAKDNETISLQLDETSPKIKASDLANVKDILGTCTTKVPSAYSDRTTNIRLFTNSLNCSIAMPGETISLDKIAGERGVSQGYKSAKIYTNGEIVDGLAGGICQAVSTIYNAVLYSDLGIVERAPHMFTVTYAAPGKDATIASGSVDFKFKNTTNYPIVLQCWVDGTDVNANIWGYNETPNKKIDIQAKLIHSSGSSVETKTYKYTYIDNKLKDTKMISHDYYKKH